MVGTVVGTGARAISTTAARSGGVLKVTSIIILLVRCSMAGNRICVKEDEHREVAEGRVREVRESVREEDLWWE